MRKPIIIALTLALAACGGYQRSDGTIMLGPNALSDDPYKHPTYPDYATFSVEYADRAEWLKAAGTHEQKLCIMRETLKELPLSLQQELDDFAANRISLLESEYGALRRRADSYFKDSRTVEAVRERAKRVCV